MAVCELKQGAKRQSNANVLKQKNAMLEKLLSRFNRVAAPVMYKIFITDAADAMNMIFLKECRQRLSNNSMFLMLRMSYFNTIIVHFEI